MNKLIILLFLIPFVVLSQLPYSWTTGVDPGWNSSGGDGNKDLQWRAGCAVVTTNCNGNYNDTEFSIYTSPIRNTTCGNASSVSITFTASGNAEYGYDFLFIEYSLNGGATWINPYGIGVGWTGNFGAGTTIPAIIVPTSTTFMFRFIFDSDWVFNYSGYKITDFDINCNVVLPINLISFKGYKQPKENKLVWLIESENDCDYYTLERSTNGTQWEVINNITATNSDTYVVYDSNFQEVINYYRLSQTNLDGSKMVYENEIVSIDNRTGKIKIISITNLLGQSIDDNYSGVIIITYEDGSTIKKLKE